MVPRNKLACTRERNWEKEGKWQDLLNTASYVRKITEAAPYVTIIHRRPWFADLLGYLKVFSFPLCFSSTASNVGLQKDALQIEMVRDSFGYFSITHNKSSPYSSFVPTKQRCYIVEFADRSQVSGLKNVKNIQLHLIYSSICVFK